MARRWVREQVSQKARRRPFSTDVVQVRVSPSGAWVPQKSHVTVSLTLPRLPPSISPHVSREASSEISTSRYVVTVTTYRLVV